MAAWHEGNARRFAAEFHPTATWIVDGVLHSGQAAIQAWAQSVLDKTPHVRVFKRRAFHDNDEPNWHAAELVFRASADGEHCIEIERGVLLQIVDGCIVFGRVHNDPRSRRVVQANDPLRPEIWPIDIPPRQRDMTHDEIVAMQMRHVMQGWRLGDDDIVVSCHAPTSVIQTPYETVIGHDMIRTTVRAYFANYADTEIRIHRIVYDGEYLAINQTWLCTNRKTGVRAGDEDLNIGVIRDGKLWRWREYYDCTRSAQTLEQTVFGKVSS